jgi:hypothetical protein
MIRSESQTSVKDRISLCLTYITMPTYHISLCLKSDSIVYDPNKKISEIFLNFVNRFVDEYLKNTFSLTKSRIFVHSLQKMLKHSLCLSYAATGNHWMNDNFDIEILANFGKIWSSATFCDDLYTYVDSMQCVSREIRSKFCEMWKNTQKFHLKPCK